ncbi:MAG: hypothetical protein KME03_04995 [Aphanocapsa lilacina HA4352-LM1]|jgi:hypothetical protein|nr:hypothetical protein [Aphanocapsa lilacina HA4352-LM1]
MKKQMVILALCLMGAVGAPPLAAQLSEQSAPPQPTREEIQKNRQQIVLANVELNDTEKKAFLPVYEKYQTGVYSLEERLEKTIEEYAKFYNSDSLTDKKAGELLDTSLSIRKAKLELLNSYVAQLKKILPLKKVARITQVENKMDAIVNYYLAAVIPLAK